MHFILYNSNNKDNNGNISIYHNKNDEDYLSKKKNKNWQGQRLQWRQLHELYFARCAFKEKEKKYKYTTFVQFLCHFIINKNKSHKFFSTVHA